MSTRRDSPTCTAWSWRSTNRLRQFLLSWSKVWRPVQCHHKRIKFISTKEGKPRRIFLGVMKKMVRKYNIFCKSDFSLFQVFPYDKVSGIRKTFTTKREIEMREKLSTFPSRGYWWRDPPGTRHQGEALQVLAPGSQTGQQAGHTERGRPQVEDWAVVSGVLIVWS